MIWPWQLKMPTPSYIVILMLAFEFDAQVWKMLAEKWDVQRYLCKNRKTFCWPNHPFNRIHMNIKVYGDNCIFDGLFEHWRWSITDRPTLLVRYLQHYLEPFFSSSLAKTERHKDTKTQSKDTKTQTQHNTTAGLLLKLPCKWWF